MFLACLETCPMTRCPRFARCEEHWNADELEDMQPLAPAEPYCNSHSEDSPAMGQPDPPAKINHDEV